MSNWRNPVGPKGRNVYVRRRLLVLLGVVALVVAVVLIIMRPGSSGGAAGARDVEVPDDLVEVEQQDQAQGDGEEDPDELQACAPGRLVVTPIMDSANYGPEDQPMMSLSVENTGDEECSADLGTAGMLFEITSGTDQIWRSSDCQANPDHRAVILPPGEPLVTEGIPWNRERSSPETCELEREPVPGGGASYHLRVTAAGVQSAGTAQFQLY
jgi:hypothetical protein